MCLQDPTAGPKRNYCDPSSGSGLRNEGWRCSLRPEGQKTFWLGSNVMTSRRTPCSTCLINYLTRQPSPHFEIVGTARSLPICSARRVSSVGSVPRSRLAARRVLWHTATMSDTTTVEVGPKGRVVIPAEIRRQLGIDTGTRLAVLIDDEAVVLVPREAIERRLHALFKGVPVSMAAELRKERQAEAARELKRA